DREPEHTSERGQTAKYAPVRSMLRFAVDEGWILRSVARLRLTLAIDRSFPKWEWRDFENGHRLLVVIGYGKSKNNKRVKKRDCVRYYTHAAMKLFWENEYAGQINSSTKA